MPAGEIVPMDGTWVLKIENTKDTPFAFQLLTITNPPIANEVFALFGRMKYEKIPGQGGPWQAQMLVDFPPVPTQPQGMTFGRTFEFSGTSDWTDLILSFNRATAWAWSNPPTRLEISIALPGHGTVYLQHLQLIEYDRNDSPVFAAAPPSSIWWSGRVAGLIGGIGGSVIGCLGALIGCLAATGKARRLVLSLAKILIGLGILLTITGAVAVVLRQPYAVWYPLLLTGVVLTSVLGINLRSIKRRYDELEIRRMTSIDATGS
ncbi:MAG: hypothetical protein ACREDQ_01875 [Limisphaerales bacterium]